MNASPCLCSLLYQCSISPPSAKSNSLSVKSLPWSLSFRLLCPSITRVQQDSCLSPSKYWSACRLASVRRKRRCWYWWEGGGTRKREDDGGCGGGESADFFLPIAPFFPFSGCCLCVCLLYVWHVRVFVPCVCVYVYERAGRREGSGRHGQERVLLAHSLIRSLRSYAAAAAVPAFPRTSRFVYICVAFCTILPSLSVSSLLD